MTRKTRPTQKLSRRRAQEFRFKIDAFTPETMPMERLAEYLTELAAILGEPKDVHLVDIEEGSTIPVLRVANESVPKVKQRADAVRRGDAPRDLQRAYHRVNRMLKEDNGRAVVQQGKRGAKILEFPGRDEVEEEFVGVKQQGSIDGVLIRVGGTGDSIPILLESEGVQQAHIYTTRHIAKALARYLFEPIRAFGIGSWGRDVEGQWAMRHFRINHFEPLDSTPLSAAVTDLRSIATEWNAEAYKELTDLRHGQAVDGGA